MTTHLEAGVVQVTVVAKDSTPAMRVITHLVNTYVTASELARGLYSPGCVYRSLRVNTSAPFKRSSLPEDGEPYAALAESGEVLVNGDEVLIRVDGRTAVDVNKVRQSLVSAFKETGTAIEVRDHAVPEPHGVSVDLALDTSMAR